SLNQPAPISQNKDQSGSLVSGSREPLPMMPREGVSQKSQQRGRSLMPPAGRGRLASMPPPLAPGYDQQRRVADPLVEDQVERLFNAVKTGDTKSVEEMIRMLNIKESIHNPQSPEEDLFGVATQIRDQDTRQQMIKTIQDGIEAQKKIKPRTK